MKETRVRPTKIDKDCFFYKHYSLDRMAGAWYLYDNNLQDWIADFYAFDEACEFIYELENNMVGFSVNPIVEIEAMYGSIVKLELVRIDGIGALSLTTEHCTGHRTTVFLSTKQTAQMLDWILAGTEPE